MVVELSVRTGEKTQMVDVTAKVGEAVAQSGVREGVCLVFAPHTTAGVTLNEGADPDVAADILATLRRLVPEAAGYRHREGNAAAHILATMVGAQVLIPVREGRLALGTWQAVFLCEFDGPRARRLLVQTVGAGPG